MGRGKKQRRARRAFSDEFKAEAVRLCKVGDRTITLVAADLEPSETALREWVRRADTDAGHGPPGALTSDERTVLAQLRRENQRLLMEREILKDAGVLREGEHVKFVFIRAEKALYPIAVLCRVLGVTRRRSSMESECIGTIFTVRVLSFSSRPMTMLSWPSTSSWPSLTMWLSSKYQTRSTCSY